MANADDFYVDGADNNFDSHRPDFMREQTSTITTTNRDGETVRRSRLLPDEVTRLPSLPDFSNFKCTDVFRLINFGLQFITRNGQTTYRCPIPPTSDVNELEYISALHQCTSMAELRQCCSISSDEIANFLKSRHGLSVSPEVVRTFILKDGFTADKDDEDGDSSEGGAGKMDLVELVAALIIPNLLSIKRKHLDSKRLNGAYGKAKKSMPSARARKKSGGRAKREDDACILQDILALMIEDCTGDATPKPLDEQLVKDILYGYGERALAEDDELVKCMVEVALDGHHFSSSKNSSMNIEAASPLLDLDTFVTALTSDVSGQYDPDRESRRSTNFEDVWFHAKGDDDSNSFRLRNSLRLQGKEMPVDDYVTALHEERARDAIPCCRKKSNNKAVDSANMSARHLYSEKEKGMVATRVFADPAIDYSADTFRTRFQVVFLWISLVLFYVSYLFTWGEDGSFTAPGCQDDDGDSDGKVTCPLIRGIVGQLLLISKLIIFGGLYIVFGSTGNSIEGQETIAQMVIYSSLFLGMNFAFFFPTFDVPLVMRSPGYKEADIWQKIALAFALAVSCSQIFHTVMIYMRNHRPKWKKAFQCHFLGGNVKYEAKIKQSALFKVDNMIQNAYDVHRQVIRSKERKGSFSDDNSGFLSNFGMAVNEYSKRDGLTTYVGGITLVWQRMWDGSLFTEDGIWFSGRLVIGTVFQVLLVIAIPVVSRTVLSRIIKDVTKIDATNTQTQGPENKTRLEWALAIGSVFSFLSAFTTTILYIPSVVSTTMKFRRGVLPTLRSEDFLHRYRFALDQTTLLFPGMVWGLAISSIVIGVLFGGLIYLILWPQTQQVALNIIGNLLGLSVVLIAKIIIMQIIRFSHYAAFYRTKPLSANVVNTCMECYAIGISLWFIMVRAIKITILAALYLGRTDTPLFASGVGIFGPLEIDNWPTVTRKEILLHDAHRHPYLDTLGYLYMMQLRFRDGGFMKRACSAWRLIFVQALMPWLHKYRDVARPNHFGQKCGQMKDMSQISSRELNYSTHENMVSLRASRMMRSSMVASRWQSNLVASSILEKEDEDEMPRIERIRSEIARLQSELASLEEKEN
mmetsp:Transcript_26472/g.39307  ORF Transcript_26472/g.39307 Transcript_26472/m.39307 type:complete len:1089 (-) Transcript_26472:205-3471(-)